MLRLTTFKKFLDNNKIEYQVIDNNQPPRLDRDCQIYIIYNASGGFRVAELVILGAELFYHDEQISFVYWNSEVIDGLDFSR